MQPRANVGVQRKIERLHLVPEAVEFLGEIVGRHIVFRAPHGAVVLEAEFLRAFVGERDVAGEIPAHGLRDFVPAGPCGQQFLWIPALRHQLGEIFDILATLRSVRAPLALAVCALQLRGDARELFGLLRIRRCCEREAELQDLDLARRDGVDRQSIELRGLLRVSYLGIDGALIEFGGDIFGIAGDIGGFDPIGAAGVNVESH